MLEVATTDPDTLEMLHESALQWVAADQPLQASHALAREGAHSRWQAMAELGWTGVAIPEEHGGLGLGLDAYATIASALGRNLVVSPLLSSALLAPRLLATRPDILCEVVSGQSIIAFALDEGAHHGAARKASAVAADGGWRLQAAKRYVIDGAIADYIIIVTDDAATFLVARERCTIVPLDTIDGRAMAHVNIDGWVAAEARLDASQSDVDQAVDLARVGLAAEMIGAASNALEITIEYLKVRKQFGRRIGSFQALQHRAAKMLVAVELAGACLSRATQGSLMSADAALAKFMANEALHLVTNEMVQMHGGMGMTEEHVAGRFLKYARVGESLFGSSSQLARRYATMLGY
jgi:alkylation response protein AidB-like acyl-CoA dehydrogenase